MRLFHAARSGAVALAGVFSSTVALAGAPGPCSSPCTTFHGVGAQCAGASQNCDAPINLPVVDNCGPLSIAYTTSEAHCSDVGLNVFVDGVFVLQVPAMPPNTRSAELPLGNYPGNHTVTVDAFGVTGGCNPGIIDNWSGLIEIIGTVDLAATDPSAQFACHAAGVTFSTSVTGAAAGAVSYQWYRDGAALVDGAQPQGSTIAGAQSDTLNISGVTWLDAGDYECAVNYSCGVLTTAPAGLTTGPFGDIDNDGLVGLSDIAILILNWASPTPPAPVNADLDRSGSIGLGDVAQVILNWAADCP